MDAVRIYTGWAKKRGHRLVIQFCQILTEVKTNKLQGSVATYLRFGGVVNNQIKKGLLLSV